MAITKMTKSGFTPSTFTKYDDFLAGNAAYDPGATWLIQRITATGGETSLNFTSIPSTYKHLQIRGLYRDTYNVSPGGSLDLWMGFNSDTNPNYTQHNLTGDGTSATASGTTSIGSFRIKSGGLYSYSNTTTYGVSIIDILDYTSTSKNKTIRAFAGGNTNSTSNIFTLSLSSGVWLSTSSVTSIQMKISDSGFAAGSTYALYGIKG